MIYLCGPIKDRTDDECVAWREKAAELLSPIPILNPIRRDYRGHEAEPGIARKIVQDDLDDINNSRALLVMYDKPSVGTSMEIFYAAWYRKIPVYVVNISGEKWVSPWLMHHTTMAFHNLVDACDYIKHGWR